MWNCGAPSYKEEEADKRIREIQLGLDVRTQQYKMELRMAELEQKLDALANNRGLEFEFIPPHWELKVKEIKDGQRKD